MGMFSHLLSLICHSPRHSPAQLDAYINCDFCLAGMVVFPLYVRGIRVSSWTDSLRLSPQRRALARTLGAV